MAPYARAAAQALLDKLEPGNSRDAQKNAAGVLAAIARSTMSPLTRAFTEPAFMARLLECAFGKDASLQARLPAAKLRLLLMGIGFQ